MLIIPILIVSLIIAIVSEVRFEKKKKSKNEEMSSKEQYLHIAIIFLKTINGIAAGIILIIFDLYMADFLVGGYEFELYNFIALIVAILGFAIILFFTKKENKESIVLLIVCLIILFITPAFSGIMSRRIESSNEDYSEIEKNLETRVLKVASIDTFGLATIKSGFESNYSFSYDKVTYFNAFAIKLYEAYYVYIDENGNKHKFTSYEELFKYCMSLT